MKHNGILVCSEYNTDYQYPEDFFMAIINLFMFHYYNEKADEYKNNTIYITKEVSDQSIFNFNLDQDTKLKIIQCWYFSN